MLLNGNQIRLIAVLCFQTVTFHGARYRLESVFVQRTGYLANPKPPFGRIEPWLSRKSSGFRARPLQASAQVSCPVISFVTSQGVAKRSKPPIPSKRCCAGTRSAFSLRCTNATISPHAGGGQAFLLPFGNKKRANSKFACRTGPFPGCLRVRLIKQGAETRPIVAYPTASYRQYGPSHPNPSH